MSKQSALLLLAVPTLLIATTATGSRPAQFNYSTTPKVTGVFGQPVRSFAPAYTAGSENSLILGQGKGQIAPDYAIRNRIIDLVDRAVPGSQVRMAMYGADDRELASALGRAKLRGVDVRVVLDNAHLGADAPFPQYLLTAGLTAADIVICRKSSCIAKGGNHHNKFFTFSRVKNPNGQFVENLVVQTSSNMTGSDFKKYQDAMLFQSDEKIYDHYERYWIDLAAQVKTDDYTEPRGLTVSSHPRGYQATVYSFPSSPLKPIDPVMETLEQVTRCKAGESRILVTASQFRSARGRKIVDAAYALRKKDCQVRFILRPQGEDNSEADYIRSLGLEMAIQFAGKDGSFHSKSVIVDAYFGKKKERKQVVMAGSANLKDSSLHNDDVTVKVEDESLFQAYAQQFEHMWVHSWENMNFLEFGCSAHDSARNGCQSAVACPAGYQVESLKAVCQLETSDFPTSEALALAPENAVTAPRPKRSYGNPNKSCFVDTVTVSEGGTKNFKLSKLRNPIAFGCSEIDRSSGGDCGMRGMLVCKRSEPIKGSGPVIGPVLVVEPVCAAVKDLGTMKGEKVCGQKKDQSFAWLDVPKGKFFVVSAKVGKATTNSGFCSAKTDCINDEGRCYANDTGTPHMHCSVNSFYVCRAAQAGQKAGTKTCSITKTDSDYQWR